MIPTIEDILKALFAGDMEVETALRYINTHMDLAEKRALASQAGPVDEAKHEQDAFLAVLNLLREREASHKRDSHPFNDKFGDHPEMLERARAKEAECREVYWLVHTMAIKAERARAKHDTATASTAQAVPQNRGTEHE